MSRLMRTSDVTALPVVTLAGEDVAQVKDVVFAGSGGEVVGFTLAGRGFLAGPMKQALAWSAVSGLGADAVMIADEDVLEPVDTVVSASSATGTHRGNVLGSQVLTDAGTDLGTVVDVVVEVGPGVGTGAGIGCDVVGYEIEASEALGSAGRRLLIPLPDTLSVSGEHLMVPASASEFVSQDMAGFGAAVEAFRAQLGGGR